jgi:hypothetical protein
VGGVGDVLVKTTHHYPVILAEEDTHTATESNTQHWASNDLVTLNGGTTPTRS